MRNIINNAADLSPEQYTRALVAALEERDGHTSEHSERVTVLATILGVECGLAEHDLRLLGMAAVMHDIGKIGIPDHILLKPSAFDESEWKIMRGHTIRGERIIRSIDRSEMEAVAGIVRSHHEHFDGSGYPDGLAGEKIPVLSRILSIVDSYDAMSMTRPYHPARSHPDVMRILEQEQGYKHDPAIFERFRLSTERLH